MDTETSSTDEEEKSIQIKQEVILAAVRTLEDLENPLKNIQWTTCNNFTVELGRQQIEEYISTWEFHESWLHWSEYLEKEELEFSVRYHYRVRWSITTSRMPLPRATACVFFLIEISKVKPKSLPVEVFYILESHKHVHRPGKSCFREKWLKDIIESKIILMNSISF
ncbi:A-kinase anchor protein 14 [Phascolarctos cinereus]|uniref:A-kinase anchor protein 14 n=1 Tax=Phascolarctos cinereus TaxID=38626 RepID=A0A6P5JI47_PHACI|nr:A-kinase anchor protein 14 [Phascolarctos cinereus]XP_020830762.1 A-kinase anchor protein 14 [Phascolarctos cinereus]